MAWWRETFRNFETPYKTALFESNGKSLPAPDDKTPIDVVLFVSTV